MIKQNISIVCYLKVSSPTSQATVTVRRGRLLLWNHSKVAHVDMLSYSLIKNQVQNSFVANKVSRLLRGTQKRFPKKYIENTF